MKRRGTTTCTADKRRSRRCDSPTPRFREPCLPQRRSSSSRSSTATSIARRVCFAFRDPGVSTLVLLVRDLDAAATGLPESARRPIRRLSAGGRAMTVAVPGAHLVELLQYDKMPQTTAPADASVIGAWVRVTVESMDRTLGLYRDRFGIPCTGRATHRRITRRPCSIMVQSYAARRAPCQARP